MTELKATATAIVLCVVGICVLIVCCWGLGLLGSLLP